MKKLALILFMTGLVPATAWAEVTKEQVKKLLAAGVSEDLVLAFIRQNGPVVRLSADDLVELKAAGAGDRVLSALLAEPAGGAPDSDLPRLNPVAPLPEGGVFGSVFRYESRDRAWIPLRSTRPCPPLCTWGQTYSTMLPSFQCAPPPIVCKPCVTVCRPACPPPLWIPVRRCR